MSGARDARAIPILPARSLDETIRFYADLGFDLVRRFDPQGYVILSRDAGAIELHFFTMGVINSTESHSGCYIRVADADAMHRAFSEIELPDEGIPRLTAVEDKPWGMREFALVDPSGNLIRVGHPLAG
ncbi:MAG TPA: VOC family protein [Tepidisphaeraceae bacterium]|nr:VOC family protein [Tepidisphaeraceae bacterium]